MFTVDIYAVYICGYYECGIITAKILNLSGYSSRLNSFASVFLAKKNIWCKYFSKTYHGVANIIIHIHVSHFVRNAT